MYIITARQNGIIKDIHKVTGILYQGPNHRYAAFKFISKHIEELKEYNRQHNIISPPTASQARFIKMIENKLNITFKGKTYEEAVKWIGRNKPYYQLAFTEIT